MARIVYRTKTLRTGADGQTCYDWTEHIAHWPMAVCQNFKKSYPDNVVSIDGSVQGYDGSGTPATIQSVSRRTTVVAPVPAAPPVSNHVRTDLRSHINAAVKELR